MLLCFLNMTCFTDVVSRSFLIRSQLEQLHVRLSDKMNLKVIRLL